MNSFLRTALCAAMFAISASAASVSWTGPSDFDTEGEITFDGFNASQLVSIDTDMATFHNHGDLGTTFGLEILLNGTWTAISTYTPLDSSSYSVNLLAPATFTAGQVSGIRFTETNIIGNGFHGFSEMTVFNFDEASGVPEPGTYGLLGSAMTGLVVMARRRKRS